MNTYNGQTYQQIESNLPTNIHEVDKRRYLDNVKEFIKLGDTNKGYKECILNTNFNIIKQYIEIN
jgi:glutaredoxin-related protein